MPALLAGPVRLSVEEYRLAWEQAGLGSMHPSLLLPGLDERTFTESSAYRAAALDALRRKGLAEGTGITDDLADALGLIARPLAEITATVLRDTGATELVASGQQYLAVLATLHAEHLELEPIPADDVARSVAQRLAEAPAAPGRPVTVLRELLAAPSTADAERRLVDAGVLRGDIEQLKAHTSGPTLSAAKIGTARGDGRGARSEGAFALNYLRKPHGGIVIHYRRGPDGRVLCTMEPADATVLARLIGHQLTR